MAFEVVIARGAEEDLRGIYEYIEATESPERAERVLDRLVGAPLRLAELPERGAHPPELLELGLREYRQIMAGPYRVIYHVAGDEVVIDVIADSRRDMQSLLARRLLRA